MKPPRVENVEEYWVLPPPDASERLRYWFKAITGGWRPNKRIRAMGYAEASAWYGVYIWEYLFVIKKLLWTLPPRGCAVNIRSIRMMHREDTARTLQGLEPSRRLL